MFGKFREWKDALCLPPFFQFFFHENLCFYYSRGVGNAFYFFAAVF